MSFATQRLLIAFDGEVECRRSAGAINLSLHGLERRGAQARVPGAAQVLLAAATPDSLPGGLHDVSVWAVQPPGRLLIRARELQQSLSCRSVQVHRAAAAAFFGAVPPPRVPPLVRFGWMLLLQLLRLPLVAALLTRSRGHR